MTRISLNFRLILAVLVSAAAFEVRGSAPVSATPLTREQLMSALSRDLAAHFNLDGDLQLDLLRPWAPPARLATSWDASILEYPAVASSSMLVKCRIVADGAPVGEATVLLRAALWRDAWVARQPLPVGATFDPSMLDTRRVDVLRDRDVLPAAVGDRTYVFARGIAAGRLLTWHDVARRPLVRKGELVEVSAGEGMLLITMKALAMENGAKGETVTVRNPVSRKDFAALVIDEQRVQVRF